MRYKEAIEHILERLKNELSATLHYHSLDHTLDVMKSVEEIAAAENVMGEELHLLLTAAAYHDCGFLFTYSEHEERGCTYAREVLPTYGFDEEQIDRVAYLIMCTKIPQRANDHSGHILCDADLDYLGKEDYDEISASLRKEMWENGIALDDHRWMDVQIDFLKQQYFFTDFAKRLRQENKDAVLQRLVERRHVEFGDPIE